MHAAAVLASVGEREQWKRVFESTDDRVVLDALKFLVSMRDGKPAQQINVTSQSLTISADDVAKARAIVRELRGDGGDGDSQPVLAAYGGRGVDGVNVTSAVTFCDALMLSGLEPGENGG